MNQTFQAYTYTLCGQSDKLQVNVHALAWQPIPWLLLKWKHSSVGGSERSSDNLIKLLLAMRQSWHFLKHSEDFPTLVQISEIFLVPWFLHLKTPMSRPSPHENQASSRNSQLIFEWDCSICVGFQFPVHNLVLEYTFYAAMDWFSCFVFQSTQEDISDDEDFVPYVPLKERRRLELEKREKYLKQKADPQPHTETVHTSREPVLEKVRDKSWRSKGSELREKSNH